MRLAFVLAAISGTFAQAKGSQRPNALGERCKWNSVASAVYKPRGNCVSIVRKVPNKFNDAGLHAGKADRSNLFAHSWRVVNVAGLRQTYMLWEREVCLIDHERKSYVQIRNQPVPV